MVENNLGLFAPKKVKFSGIPEACNVSCNYLSKSSYKPEFIVKQANLPTVCGFGDRP